jgi:hypothetical protein
VSDDDPEFFRPTDYEDRQREVFLKRQRAANPNSADDRGATAQIRGEGVSVTDFYAYMPMHTYIFAPTREM